MKKVFENGRVMIMVGIQVLHLVVNLIAMMTIVMTTKVMKIATGMVRRIPQERASMLIQQVAAVGVEF